MTDMRIVNHPKELDWKKGPLPPVESVPDGVFALAWIGKAGKLQMILNVHPWYNDLNPRRWCSTSGMPVGAYLSAGDAVEWYTWTKAPESFV